MCEAEFFVISDEHGIEGGFTTWMDARYFRDSRGYGDLVVRICGRYFSVEKEYKF